MVLLAVLGIAAVIAAAVYSRKMAEKRRQELRAVAQELGFRFDALKDADHDERFPQFEVFRRGHSRCAFNTLQGVAQIGDRSFAAKMGDYEYKVTTSNGKSTTTTTYRFSYLILTLPFPGVPSLTIRREGVFDKVAGVLGFDDIDFESVEFSRRFHVKSADKRFAYDVIDPRMMEFLLAGEAPVVDIDGGACCFHGGNRQWTPQQFKAMLSWSKAFFERWPRHVVDALTRS